MTKTEMTVHEKRTLFSKNVKNPIINRNTIQVLYTQFHVHTIVKS